IAGLSGTSALAISLDATAVNDPALTSQLSDAPVLAEAAEAESGTLGKIAAAGAPELPVPPSLLLFAAGLAGVIAVHRRPLR
ncbi:MAG: hypothetical protein AAFQ75_06410, partial [Pseudomonadota bacterium]